jgi:hypothetical protein
MRNGERYGGFQCAYIRSLRYWHRLGRQRLGPVVVDLHGQQRRHYRQLLGPASHIYDRQNILHRGER